MKLHFLLIWSWALILAVSSYKRYDGYKVLLAKPTTAQQAQFLHNLMLTKPKVDFWIEPKVTDQNKEVVFMIAPEDYAVVNFKSNLLKLRTKVLHDNVQSLLDAENQHRRNTVNEKSYNYKNFNDLETYMAEIDNIADNCPDDVICRVSVIGQSAEGRDIKLLKIDTGAFSEFVIDGCIHAREWLSCATVMKLVRHMISNTLDPHAAEILRSHNWHIIPIANPDGYSYTHTDDRLWRKSRNVNVGSKCLGTDLNRNFDFKWNSGGASTDPCSASYCGRGAASEPETKALQYAGVQASLSGHLTVWLSFHTYAKMLLWPYGDGTSAYNEANIARVANAMCSAIAGTFHTKWKCGNAFKTLYKSSGTSRDWAAGVARALYSFTVELRGDYFVVDSSEIESSFIEVWNGLKACIKEVQAIEKIKFKTK